MKTIVTRVSDALDINVRIGAGAPDVGLTYSIVSPSFARIASIVPSTGVMAFTVPGIGVVHANRTDNGLLVERILVNVLSDAQYAYNSTVPGNANYTVAPGFVPVDSALLGAVNGIATLGSDGKVIPQQLPPGSGGTSGAITNLSVIGDLSTAAPTQDLGYKVNMGAKTIVSIVIQIDATVIVGGASTDIDLLMATSLGQPFITLFTTKAKPQIAASGGVNYLVLSGATLPDITSIPDGAILTTRVSSAPVNTLDLNIDLYTA